MVHSINLWSFFNFGGSPGEQENSFPSSLHNRRKIEHVGESLTNSNHRDRPISFVQTVLSVSEEILIIRKDAPLSTRHFLFLDLVASRLMVGQRLCNELHIV